MANNQAFAMSSGDDLNDRKKQNVGVQEQQINQQPVNAIREDTEQTFYAGNQQKTSQDQLFVNSEENLNKKSEISEQQQEKLDFFVKRLKKRSKKKNDN